MFCHSGLESLTETISVQCQLNLTSHDCYRPHTRSSDVELVSTWYTMKRLIDASTQMGYNIHYIVEHPATMIYKDVNRCIRLFSEMLAIYHMTPNLWEVYFCHLAVILPQISLSRFRFSTLSMSWGSLKPDFDIET